MSRRRIVALLCVALALAGIAAAALFVDFDREDEERAARTLGPPPRITTRNGLSVLVLSAAEQMEIPVPVIVRLSGTQEEAGRKMLEGSRYIPVANVREAAQRVKEVVASSQ